ncbi:hypothetical protein FSPOR_6834 [Fusarium sporotrichioides]|uniref:Uncharacterized protein n=1 Tax=Fusarium sporotrichioides TaxID=5514 RepID=A0A395S0R7_FUSSP|nr:hypothetical protein FSPOR_6834 [Fusarium sporotrichioides]
MDENLFFPALGADDIDSMIDENSSLASSDSRPQQQPSQWQWPGQIDINRIPPENSFGMSQQTLPNEIFAQPPYAIPQPVIETQMNAQVPQLAPMAYNPPPPLIPNNLFDVPFFRGNRINRDIRAQEQNNNSLFLEGGQLIAPNHSHYPCQADSTTTPVKSHEDYGLGREVCRKLGDFPVHKPLAVFCLVCRKALPKFAVRCGSCTEYARKQPPGTLELRYCIICKSVTCYLESIFCKYHSTQKAILSSAEKKALPCESESYGYYSNSTARPRPIESLDDSVPVEESSGWGERRDSVPSPVEGYGSNLRQDNPFIPHTSAGAGADLRPTQEYGQKREFFDRPSQTYDVNLRSDNPFLPQRSSAGGSAQVHSTQAYGGYGEPSYTSDQDYRQRYGYGQSEGYQSRYRDAASYPRSDTIEAYAPQGFNNPFAPNTSSPPSHNIPPLGYEYEHRTNQRSDNPFDSPALTAQSYYSQAPFYQSTSAGPSYNQGLGFQRIDSELLDSGYHVNQPPGGSFNGTQQDRQNENQNQYRYQPTRQASGSFPIHCVKCQDMIGDTAVRCGPCNENHQQNLFMGTSLSESRHCIICRVSVPGMYITCGDHPGEEFLNREQKSFVRRQDDLCRSYYSCEKEPGERQCAEYLLRGV